MKYMLIIAGHEGGWEDRSPEEAKAEMGRWFAYTQELEDAGYDPVLARHGIEGAEEVIVDGR